MLPYSSGILTAVLPCLAYDDRKKSILYSGEAVKWRDPEWEGAPLGSFTSPNGLAFRKQEMELSVG